VPGWREGDDGKAGECVGADKSMRISVKPGTDTDKYDAFKMDMWARCTKGEDKWGVNDLRVNNGKMELYVDDEIQKELSHKKTSDDTSHESLAKLFLKGKNRDMHVSIRFIPDKRDREAWAEVFVNAMGVDDFTDACLTNKLCLEKLGDGSDEAYKLRNSNEEQYKCLTSDGNNDSDKCTEWKKCISGHDQTQTKVLGYLLTAALKTPGSLIETNASSSTATLSEQGRASCIDPRTADPEAWDCQCMADLKDQCADKADDEQADCFRQLMCGHEAICAAWKSSFCGGGLIEAIQQRTSTKVKKSAATEDNADMDSILRGKCAN